MRHDDEILTDNSKINYCLQCKKCKYWGNRNDPFSNKYDKANCDMYQIPSTKPITVINNTGVCAYREEA